MIKMDIDTLMKEVSMERQRVRTIAGMYGMFESVHLETECECCKLVIYLTIPYFSKFKRSADCPSGAGTFGFNSYDLLTAVVIGFSVVANVIVNSNKNENNNNNNDLQVQ